MNSTEPDRPHAVPSARPLIWKWIRNRLVEGLLVALPILLTFWILRWIYAGLSAYVIDPIARLVIHNAARFKGAPELPYWFETFAAPAIAVALTVLILFGCGVLAHSQVRRIVDAVLLRVPVVAPIYDAVRNVFQCFRQTDGKPAPQRVVLVSFPHPGMRLPAIVTSTCLDVHTRQPLLCVYVPTTPVPTSGFFLLVPEEETTELNWDAQQTLQAIISGGLTAPPEVTYYRQQPATPPLPSSSAATSEAAPLEAAAPGASREA